MNNTLTIEQDTEWLEEQRANGKWARTKLTLAKTWTVYKRVGSPSYLTPVLFSVTKKAAEAFVAQSSTIN